MSKTAKILIWVFVGAPAILIALLFIAFQVLIASYKPDHAFGEKPLPIAPDYSMRSNSVSYTHLTLPTNACV